MKNSTIGILILGCLCLAGVTVLFFSRDVDTQSGTKVDFLDADLILIPQKAETYGSRFVVADSEQPLYLPSDTYERIRNETEIAALTYHVHLGKPLSDCCTFIDGPIIAFEEKSDFIIAPLVAERRKNTPLAKYELLEGGAIHDYLGLITDILLLGNNSKITGHLRHTGTNFDNAIFMRIEDIDSISSEYLPPNYQPKNISVIFIRLHDGVNMAAFAAKIRNAYPEIAVLSKGAFPQGLSGVH